MNILQKIKSGITYFDGSMGTMLHSTGLKAGELPELWNLTRPDTILEIHKKYICAGADIITANTFGVNPFKFREQELEKCVSAGMAIARRAADQSGKCSAALDIGSMGKLIKPFGPIEFEEAVEAFKRIIKAGAPLADLILIETMNDCYETKAAVLAARESCSLPVFATNVYGTDGKTLSGTSPKAMIAMLEGLGVDALGMNCSLGPKQMKKLVPEFLNAASVPVIVMPNAGLPRADASGNAIYDIDPDEFSDIMAEIADMGISILGGCCGTTPNHIEKTVKKTISKQFTAVSAKRETLVSSYTHAVEIGARPVLIGERINPTGKKRLKQALKDGDTAYILNEAITQQEKGADILDVNVGLPDIDEVKILAKITSELQAVSNLPLQLDTSDCVALEAALRIYNGKPIINSVNGKSESMKKIFPLVKKYGGVVVALTLDENGIPDTAEERLNIAEKILKTAESYGVNKKDIIFDTLAMAASSDTSAPQTALSALKLIRTKLNCNTILGISNVSFGLPCREAINAAFFTLALENGLSAAIINPYSEEILKAFRSFLLLKNLDPQCAGYIQFAQNLPKEKTIIPVNATKNTAEQTVDGNISTLKRAIIRGLKTEAALLTKQLLQTCEALKLIDEEIIPALDEIGKGYEKNTVFLPQLLMSAEAAKSAFSEIKAYLSAIGKTGPERCKIVLATVKGDIHDIGKNIVKTLLENYGFIVIDLGKDAEPQKITETAIKEKAPIVGLSALMTTTVPSMAETIKLLRQRAPQIKIVVGGAVLTQEYADKIGADKYAKDAMETVRYAESIDKQINK